MRGVDQWRQLWSSAPQMQRLQHANVMPDTDTGAATAGMAPPLVTPANAFSPLTDQTKFTGRLWHFVRLTDPRTVFCSTQTLYEARSQLHQLRETGESACSQSELRRHHQLYQACFHPDTGELQALPGRMCFMLYGSLFIVGGMLKFYRSTSAVLLWQWINQSYSAGINYTNRNATSPLSNKQLATAYVSATTVALTAAVALRRAARALPAASVAHRLVPFGAVMAGQLANIPLMRQYELRQGVAVQTADEQVAGQSRLAAAKGMCLVWLSRLVLNTPCLALVPPMLGRLERLNCPAKLRGPMLLGSNLTLTAVAVLLANPVACAVFPQHSSIKASVVQTWESKALLPALLPNQLLYFNKGL